MMHYVIAWIRGGLRSWPWAGLKADSVEAEPHENLLLKDAEGRSGVAGENYQVAQVHALLEPCGLVKLDGVIYAARWRGPIPSPAIGELVHIIEDEARQNTYIAFSAEDPISYDRTAQLAGSQPLAREHDPIELNNS